MNKEQTYFDLLKFAMPTNYTDFALKGIVKQYLAQELRGEGEKKIHQIVLKREKDPNYNPDDFHHETGENEE